MRLVEYSSMILEARLAAPRSRVHNRKDKNEKMDIRDSQYSLWVDDFELSCAVSLNLTLSIQASQVFNDHDGSMRNREKDIYYISDAQYCKVGDTFKS